MPGEKKSNLIVDDFVKEIIYPGLFDVAAFF